MRWFATGVIYIAATFEAKRPQKGEYYSFLSTLKKQNKIISILKNSQKMFWF